MSIPITDQTSFTLHWVYYSSTKCRIIQGQATSAHHRSNLFHKKCWKTANKPSIYVWPSTEKRSTRVFFYYLIRRHWSFAALGQPRGDVAVISQVTLTSDEDDWGVRCHYTDLRAPEVEGWEETGGVRDLVAEHEHISLTKSQVTSWTTRWRMRTCNIK